MNKKSRYGPRDPSRKIRTEILVKIRVRNVQNAWMATHLVTKRCDLGSLGVPGPASTPGDAAGAEPGPGGFAESLGVLVLIPLNYSHTQDCYPAAAGGIEMVFAPVQATGLGNL